jgi:hypothetical protein
MTTRYVLERPGLCECTGSARDGVCKDLYRVNDSSARSQLFTVYIKVGIAI